MNQSYPWEQSYPPALRNYRPDEDTLPESLDEIARESSVEFGKSTAFTLQLPDGPGASLSFTDVDTHSDDFAGYLVGALGLAPGDVVAVQLPNSLHYPITVFGTWKAGLVLTNVNPLYTERELRQQLQDSGAKLLVAHSLSLPVAAKVARECGVPVVVVGLWEFFAAPLASAIRTGMIARMGPGGAELLAAHSSFERVLKEGRKLGTARRRHPVAVYQYTGGTTGRSKGAVLTHRNIAWALRMTEDFLAADNAAIDLRDVVLTVLPLYHIFAFVINFLLFFRKGAHNVLVPNPRPLANLRPAFDQFRISWMTGVDTLYAGLLAEPWFQENPPKLRYALSGGTALRPITAERWRAAVSSIVEGYGMTETSCVVSFNPPNASPRPGSAGLPMPGSEVRVVDASGKTVAFGERGELQVRGPHVTSGYLNQPDENKTAIADGWLRTGDVVTMDENGWIAIVDRVKDMVLVSGFNVYPNEVESIIATHPDVAEVGVIGIPDATTGEAVCAYVVARREGLTADEVIDYCRTQLTAYKVPKQIRFAPQLPKSPVGKILRAQLRQESVNA